MIKKLNTYSISCKPTVRIKKKFFNLVAACAYALADPVNQVTYLFKITIARKLFNPPEADEGLIPRPSGRKKISG